MGAMIDLRAYQAEVIDAVEQSKTRRVIVVAPTGSGKTVIATSVIGACYGPVLFLAHRRELIFQAAKKLMEGGIKPGLILARKEVDPGAGVQVASIQSIAYAKSIQRASGDAY